MSSIEALEARIAPATLLPGGKVVTFTDIDGDAVTVKFSKSVLTAGNVGGIFAFSGSTFASTGKQKLSALLLANLGAAANGVDITVSAKCSATLGGNGVIDLQGIDASNVNYANGTGNGIDLGKVIVRGNIDYIDAGDANLTTPALKFLDVQTLGAVGDGVTSSMYGGVGTFKVRGNMSGDLIIDGFNDTAAQTTLQSLIVGGSMGAGFDSSLAGHVKVSGNLVSARIVHDLRGGYTPSTGSIEVGGNLGKLSIGGSIIGGSVISTGYVFVAGTLSHFNIRGDVAGGTGVGSAFIQANSIGTGFIGGDVRGYQGGVVFMAQDTVGSILVTQTITSLTIGGSLIGGSIFAGVGPGADGYIGNGDDSDLSGAIVSKISKLIIKGTAQGTATSGDSFGIEANQIAMVKIGAVTYRPTDPLLSFSTGVLLSPTSGDIKLRTL